MMPSTIDAPAPKLNIKFPKPISFEWVRFEDNLPDNSGSQAIKAAVHIDDLRRRWSPSTAGEYATALDQYVRWLERTNRVTLRSKVAAAFIWRSMDQEVVAHSSIFFEHAMVHLTTGLMRSVQRLDGRRHFDLANDSLGKLITYHGDTTSAYLKHLVTMCKDLCEVRGMISGLDDQPNKSDLEICRRALNMLPDVPRASQLFSYCEDLREHLATRYCTAYAVDAADRERFDEAEVAMSVLGEDHPLRVKYSKMRISVLQQKIPFETWIFSIADEEPIQNIPEVRTTSRAPLFDFIDADDADEDVQEARAQVGEEMGQKM